MVKGSNIFYGWMIVGISTLVFAIVRGVNDSFSVFFVAFLEEFGWGRAAVAGVFSCARLTEGVISVGVGMLSDRFGLRRLVPMSACLVAIGLVLASQAQTLWTLYVAYGLVFAVGYCGLGELSHVPVISRWFIKQRGTALGIAMASMGLGILLIVPLTQLFILHLGWRWAYIALAAIVLVGVIPPTLLWQRERPKNMGLLPDGEVPVELPRRSAIMVRRSTHTMPVGQEWTLRTALRTPPCGCSLPCASLHRSA